MKNPYSGKSACTASRWGLLVLLVTLPLFAQPTSGPVRGDEPVQLNPFVVETAQVTGWVATNSLSGSRLNTKLSDSSAAIDVFTKDFMEDLGASNLEEVARYAVNATDSSTNGDQNLNPIVGASEQNRIRGYLGSVGRDFFSWQPPIDLYNMEQVDQSRGPNGILFGQGKPGGLLNSTTKRARVERSAGKLELQLGSDRLRRATLDYNQVLLDRKLALRMNLLGHRTETPVLYEYFDKDGVHFAVTAKPTASTTIQAAVEHLRYRDNRSTRSAPLLRTQRWEASGRPLTATAGNVLSVAQLAQGLENLSNSQYWTFVENGGVPVLNNRRTVSSANHPKRAGEIALGYIPGIEGVNNLGPDSFRFADTKDYFLNIDQRLTDHWYAQLSVDVFNLDWDARRSGGATGNNIRGDANVNLVSGGTNPFAGRLYEDYNWQWLPMSTDGKRGYLTTSYALDLGRFGRHQVAGLYQLSKEAQRFTIYRENVLINGAPINRDPNNANNRLSRRHYFTEGDLATYTAGQPYRSLEPWRDAAGNIYSTYWANTDNDPRDAETDLSAYMVAAQSAFFDGRLHTTMGVRRENIRGRDFNYILTPDATTYIRNPQDVVKTDESYDTRTYGGVYHVTKRLSVFGNFSDNNAPDGALELTLIPDGRKPPATKGKTRDFGLMIRTPDDRLSLRLTAYQTQVTDFRVTAAVETSVTARNNNVLAALLDPLGNGEPFLGGAASTGADRLITPEIYTARFLRGSGFLIDQESRGYEIQLHGQPVKNWNVRLSYAYNDRKETNVGTDVSAQLDNMIAFWRTFPGNTQSASGNTLTDEIALIESYRQNQIETRKYSTAFRKHNANVFSTYSFEPGWLRGVSIGGGVRYQSPNVIGILPDGSPQRGRALLEMDAFLKYAFRLSAGRRWVLQINGSQLNQAHLRTVPTLVSAEGIIERNTLLYPRQFRFSTRIEF